MCPKILPLLCQTLLFERQFEKATSIVLKGLYILQQHLPLNFIPLKSIIYPSTAREDFLELISFIARFSFRRSCFETSKNLWKFGISLTIDDPCNFLLLAAIPALYSKDKEFINEIINSNKTWRNIPINFLPDWTISYALLNLPDDCELIAHEISKWPFYFTDFGKESNVEPSNLLSSLSEAFKRRTKKLFENNDLKDFLETSIILSTEIDESEFQAIALSYWYDVITDGIEVGEFVEEFVLPTG